MTRVLLKVLAVLSFAAASLFAQDTGATANGNWNDAAIWTGGTVPGSSNNVYIGSTYPAGSASIATVTVSGDQSAANVYLGYGSSSASGTLDLTGGVLTLSEGLIIGQSGGVGSIVESGGSLSAADVYLYSGNSLTLGTADTVGYLQLTGASTATTSAAGNITGNAAVYDGSTLNLGANLSLPTGSLDVQDAGSVLNMNGNGISANQVFLGWYGSSPTTIENRGAFTTSNLYVGNGQTFNLNSSDSVTNFYLSDSTGTLNSGVSSLQLQNGASATTTAAGNVTGSVAVDSGSTLNLGTNLTLSGNLNLQDSGSVLNMNGNSVTANQIFLGWYGSSPVSIQNRGVLSTANLYVGNGQTFNLSSSDSVTNFYLDGGSSTTLNSGVSVSSLQLSNGSTATTTTVGNITGYASVLSGSTLNMGDNLNVSGNLNVQDSGSVLNMNGHSATANQIFLGWYGASPVTVQNRGALTANYLYVGNGQTFNLNSADSVSNFYLSGSTSTLNSSVSSLQLQNGSTATTTTAGNVTENAGVLTGSTLNLGANLNLSGSLNVQDSGSVLNMNGHSATANQIFLGWYGASSVTLQNRGTLTANYLYVGNGQALTLNSGDSAVNLQTGSGATVTTTATGNITGSLTVTSGSTMDLGAALNLSGDLDIQDSGSVLNTDGNSVTADVLFAGWDGGSPITVNDSGSLIDASELYIGNGTDLNMGAGDVVSYLIDLMDSSTLTVAQTTGELTGLTFDGDSVNNFTIGTNSTMDLVLATQTLPNWDFRWQDPASGGNWVSTLDSMIADGQIDITAPDGYTVTDDGGYTYIDGGTSISATPEPSSGILLGSVFFGLIGFLSFKRWRAHMS